MAFVNITKGTLNPYKVNTQTLNEGQFSWMTSDTGKQIGSEKQNTIDVFMYDNEGNQWHEDKYEGYGEFGGMDFYTLLAKMNGYSDEDLILKLKGKDLRDIGIDIAFGKIKTKAKGNKVLFPALVEDPKFNWKRHDFKNEPESDPDQSWYQEDEYEAWDESNSIEKPEGLDEGRVKQFTADLNGMIKDIKRGYGWIDPEFVEDTWENTSDTIEFELVKLEIYRQLIKAGILAHADDNDEESAGKYVKSLKDLNIAESEVNESLAFSIAGGIVLGVVGVIALVNGAKVAAGLAGIAIAKAGDAAEAKRAAKRAAARLKDKKAILDPIAKKFENDDKLKQMYVDLAPYMGTSNAKNRASAKVRTEQLGIIAKYIKSKLTPDENAYFTDLSKYLRTGAPETIEGGWHDDTDESVAEGKKYTVSDFKVGDRVIIARGGNKPGVVKKVTKAPNNLVYVSWNPKRPSDESQAFRAHELIPESVAEATVVMDAIDPKSNVLKKLLKKHNVKMKVLTMNGPGGGHPEVEMTGSREDLQAVLADPNGWDDSDLGEYIEESLVNEAASLVDEVTGKAVKLPYKTKDFRGDAITVKGFTEPHKSSSSGRIQTDQGEFFPGVAGVKIVGHKFEGVTEAKSNIAKKWDSTNTMMDDLREFITDAKDAGGEELVMDIADALKLMTNYAMGMTKESKDLTWNSLKESLGLNEARSINKISKEHSQVVVDMKQTVDSWKEAEGDRKSELLEMLRELNKRKSELEKELDDAVAGKDRDVQLALEEAKNLAYLEIDIKTIFKDEQEG